MRSQGLKSNYRFDISAAQTTLTKMKVDPMWVDFVEFHTSPGFYKVRTRGRPPWVLNRQGPGA
eukprot:7660133-Pyramimonas_sp.AAC.1